MRMNIITRAGQQSSPRRQFSRVRRFSEPADAGFLLSFFPGRSQPALFFFSGRWPVSWEHKPASAGMLDSVCFVVLGVLLGLGVILFDLKFGIARFADILLS
jgi:hypothetical protein